MAKAELHSKSALRVSEILVSKPHIRKFMPGLTKPMALKIIITFFSVVAKMMLCGRRVYMFDGSSFGIYRSDYKKGEMPPLKRSRFKGKVELANTPGRNRYKYNFIFDDPIRLKQGNPKSKKLRFDASTKIKKTFQRILKETTLEYADNPWQ